MHLVFKLALFLLNTILKGSTQSVAQMVWACSNLFVHLLFERLSMIQDKHPFVLNLVHLLRVNRVDHLLLHPHFPKVVVN